MTNEQAIDNLSVLWERMRESHDGNAFVADVSIESLDMAIEALQKQVPQKVKQQYKSYNGAITCFEEFVCPACGVLFYDDYSETTQYYDFCPNCGQAIDWSDNE